MDVISHVPLKALKRMMMMMMMMMMMNFPLLQKHSKEK